jgi:crotonobetainyl-CoA:carnitine CoA-transferase CaiB-like acyl-CoA transferase
VTIGANNDRLWQRFVQDVVERPEWLTDPRFATLTDRMAHIDELEREIEAITTARTTDDWIALLDRAGVPGGPVLTYDEALADPHVQARGMVVEVDHPIIGPMRTLGPPARFSGMDCTVKRPAPWLGQHTTDVLREGGLDDEEIQRLYEGGVVFDQYSDRDREAVR